MKKLINSINALSQRKILFANKLKVTIKIVVLFIACNSVTCITPQKLYAQQQTSVSFQVFYDNLSPYGTWVNNSAYGYVWVPRVAVGFTPYGTNGYWLFTVDGWTWFSDYAWGWAPFHYGRWFYDYFYGWVWVPDTVWGPSWVVWIGSGDYYGWAPMGPGISIDFAYTNYFGLPYDCWRFVRCRDFGRRDIHNYYIGKPNYKTMFDNCKPIKKFRDDKTRDTRYNEGPDRTEVEQHVGRTFTPVAIKDDTSPGEHLNNDQLEIYRPPLQKNISVERKPIPSKVEDWQGTQSPRQQTTLEQPTYQQPARKHPTIQQSTKEQSIYRQPERKQPINVQPTYQQPVRRQPTIQQKAEPTNVQPTYQQPVRRQPTIPQQAKDPPANQQPIREQPSKQSTREPPTHQQPVKEQTTKPAPAKQER